jgi:tetratricopeptide (TPR) repeat protein
MLLRGKGDVSPQPHREPSEKAKSLCQQAKMHQEQGSLNEAIAAYDDALEEYCNSVGPQDCKILGIRESLALLLRDNGDFLRAEAEFSTVYTAHEETYGLWHRATLRTAIELGNILAHVGRLDNAGDIVEKTLKAFQEQDGRDCAEKYAASYSLGKIFAQQNTAEEALPLYHRALPGLERTLGPDH